jgi:SAM-dependent methyltransferase
MANASLGNLLRRIVPYPLRKLRIRLMSRADPLADVRTELQQIRELLAYEAHVPLPPPRHLQVRVVGSYAPDFVASGYRTCAVMEDAVASAGASLRDFASVYDFGCGCGRVTRAFRGLHPSARLRGSDIDPEAIDWLKEHCPGVAEFSVNSPAPPTPHEDGSFDFIYGISVFTHLPEGTQFQWLAELRRVAKPGGILFLTTHGERHHRRLDPFALGTLRKHGFYYAKSRYVTTEGLPQFYQTAYHAHDYIHREWGRYFDVVEIRDGALDGQDTVVLKARN